MGSAWYFLATGGVYLAGGIFPRILNLLNEPEFRAAFENKEPYRQLAHSIPVYIVTQPDAVMHGMAAIARRPGKFEIDFSTRDWAR